MARRLTVLKFGGSVLGTEKDLPRAISEVYRWVRANDKVVVVASAYYGTTDRLEARALVLVVHAGVGAAHPLAQPVAIAVHVLHPVIQIAPQPAEIIQPAVGALHHPARTDAAGIGACVWPTFSISSQTAPGSSTTSAHRATIVSRPRA